MESHFNVERGKGGGDWKEGQKEREEVKDRKRGRKWVGRERSLT
jgi:hypothetical protein